MNRRTSFTILGAAAMAAAVGHRVRAQSTASHRDTLILPKDTEVRIGGSRTIEIGDGYHVWTKKVGDEIGRAHV